MDSLNLNIALSKVEVAERKDKRRLFKRISSDNLEYFRSIIYIYFKKCMNIFEKLIM